MDRTNRIVSDRRVGDGSYLIVFMLLVIVSVAITCVVAIFSLGFALLVCLVQIPWLVLTWKVKHITWTKTKIHIKGIVGEEETYPISSIGRFGYLIYPSYCYVRLTGGKHFLFYVNFRFDRFRYVDELNKELEQLQSDELYGE